MDMKIFVDALTIKEMNELSNLIYEKRQEYARANARPLSVYEMELVGKGKWMLAIKEYRTRVGVGLVEAKVAVDAFRESYSRIVLG